MIHSGLWEKIQENVKKTVFQNRPNRLKSLWCVSDTNESNKISF